jgi:hypothetical protein
MTREGLPEDADQRVWTGGPRAIDTFHRVLGISSAARARGTFRVEAVRWIHGEVRVDLGGTGFGRLVIRLRTSGPGLRVLVDGPRDQLHPHARGLVRHLEAHLPSTTREALLRVLLADPDTQEDQPPAPPVMLPTRRSMGPANANPMPYAHAWEGGPREAGPWGQFFDDLVFVFSPFTAVRFIMPVVHVFHGHHECLCVTPKLATRFAFPFNQPSRKDTPVANMVRSRLGLPDQQRAQSFKRLSTDMTELDTILGATDKLARAVECALQHATPEQETVVSLHTSCLPQVMGEDVELPYRRARCTEHVHCVSKAMGHTHARELFAEELDFGPEESQVLRDLLLPPNHPRDNETRGGRSFDLVGFPDGRDLHELARLLEEAGASLNAILLPHVDVEVCRRTPRPNLQVRLPNRYYDLLYERVFDDLAPDRMSPPAPFGVAASERWLRAVGGRLSLDDTVVGAAVERARDSMSDRWRALQSVARERRVGFVVDERVLPRLTDPSRSFGLDLLEVISEMSFGVDVLCYAPDGDMSYADAGLSRAGVRRFCFRDAAELDARLAGGEFRAVYSDRMYERRLFAYGKAQFGFSDFEMGFRGALRSFERILGACVLPFYARYGRYLADGAESTFTPL